MYRELGYPLFRFSAFRSEYNDDLNNLRNFLSGKTAIFVGQSGVGKSSMINCLTTSSEAIVDDVSSANEKGKHTTTTSQMYFSNHPSADAQCADAVDGAIIDSPGIREFGLWHLTNDNIIDGFREFGQFVAQCKYRNCEHGVSDGCELQSAFDEGKVHPSRVASYLHILNSLDMH